MREAVRARLLGVLRVPDRPAAPPGDPGMLRTFRAAPGYFRYSVVAWLLKQLSAAVGLLFSYLFLRNVAGGVPFGYFGTMEQLFIALYVLQLPFSFLLLRLDFEMRWYMLTDRSLRIRHGILSVREQTMTFANVQNISVRQNPLQRAFGIATVVVRAAGGGGGQGSGKGPSAHEATFEGVDDAPGIRALIRERIRRQRGAGLGDPEEHRHFTPASSASGSAAEAAALRVLAEARALRASLAAR
jgi:membrane protein YdbS with pleckstrin-like domain